MRLSNSYPGARPPAGTQRMCNVDNFVFLANLIALLTLQSSGLCLVNAAIKLHHAT